MNIEKRQHPPTNSIVDCHQHFWQLSRGDYDWLTPELSVIYQDFSPKQLVPEISKNGINQTILVQATDTEEETHFLLDIAENTKFVAGVVGWVDMENLSALQRLKNLSVNPYFKGIRPMLQDIDDINWILKIEFNQIFEFLVERQLSFDALIRSKHLPAIYKLAQRYPALKIAINHCAKPDLSTPPTDTWKNALIKIAKCKNVSIKFSGLLTEAPLGHVSVDVIKPYFDHVIDTFGADRIMWGSDWPVIKLNGDYSLWVSITNTLLKNLSNADKYKIWSDNAKRFYSIPAY